MSRRHFCTLFDSGYLLKGLAMIQSLAKFCMDLEIYILCMDIETYSILKKLNLSYVKCIQLSEVENDELLRVKPSRGTAEYCWTLSPCLPYYILQKYQTINFITYLDADLLFFSSVDPLFDEIGESSIAIIEHRFPDRLKEREAYGRFCVQWVSFRRDEEGMACLSRWREQCIEWCYYCLEDGKMGDQKYLDEWPSRYSRCHIIVHLGAGVAPWNYEQYIFSVSAAGRIIVDNSMLIFYHFHQFQLLDNGRYDRLSGLYKATCPEPDCVYQTYEKALEVCLKEVSYVAPDFKIRLKPAMTVKVRRLIQLLAPTWAKEFLRKFLRY